MSEQVFSPTHTIGEIVTRVPKTSEIFKRSKIDFCCGGGRQLATAIAEQGLDAEKLLKELNEAYDEARKLRDQQVDWRDEPLTDLIDYIINKHHTFLAQTLPQLSDLTLTLLRVHGSNHLELTNVHKIFNTIKTDLEQHLNIEEQVLFPLIKEYEQNPSGELLSQINDIIGSMKDQHEGAGLMLKQLRSITYDYRLPDDACATYARTYQLLMELEEDIFQHIHLENNILHQRLRH